MHLRRDERGQVVVLMALLIPVFFGLGAIVMDIGNWYVHKRHLQTQVDAAALAPAPQFVGCFHDPPAANLAIAAKALEYAGDTTRDPATTNLQVQQPNDVHALLNSDVYWGADPYPPDNTLGTPCDARFLDVKATDDDAPLLWGLLPLSPSPKAKARVEIRQVHEFRGMLPWAVPEIDPRAVVALFVNEDTPGGAVFDYQELTAVDDPSLPWSEWSTMAGQEQIVFDGLNVNTGVIILISKDDPTPQVTGPLSDICNQAPGRVRCHGGATATSGLSFIHGFSGGYNGSISSPQARDVRLTPAGCSVPPDYSAAYFTLNGGCSAVVQAVIDFGVTGDPRPLNKACASVAGFTWSAGGPDPTLGVWTGSRSLPTNSGRNVVNLSWSAGNREQGTSGNCHPVQPNSGTLGKVAAPFVANSASRPVQYLKLTAAYDDGVPLTDANSVETNGPGNDYYSYNVVVGLPKPLSVDNYTDPPLLLRMASPSGSQNQAFDCDRGVNFNLEIENGCQTTYRLNYDDLDGDGDKEWRNITCAGWSTSNLPPNTFDPDPPPDCVMTETGDKTGQLRQGATARFGPGLAPPQPDCAPNNWPTNQAEADAFFGPNGYDYGNDPRYVIIVVTDDTAFTGAGNEALPIKYYAGFYAVGWDYHPTESPGCSDNWDHPIYGPVGSYNHNLDNGDVWGYFVNIVVFSGTGEPSEDLCAFGDDPNICMAVLVE